MAFGKNLIFFLPVFFALSCAQVGTLSGGKEDTYAPKVVEGKTIPPNESLNFQGKSIEMTFDEYIQLNNPQQTVVMVPNHAKLKTSIHKNTLKIEWEEELHTNTTYVISLNGTVKDFTENNDSLMYYVFSTGTSLDSLKYAVRVVDALTNQSLENVTVGLFSHIDSLKPYYFANTNSAGEATFSFVKNGTYSVKAFVDENKDLQIQTTEKIAFKSNYMALDSNLVDTIPLRLFKAKDKMKIRTFKFAAPGSFLIGANYSMKDASFFINSTKIEKEFIREIKEDSVQLFTTVTALSDIQLVVKTSNRSDTITTRITEKEKTAKIKLVPNFNTQQIGAHEAIAFHTSDQIIKLDSEKIKLRDQLDSLETVPFTATFALNKIQLDFERKSYKQLSLIIQSGAIETVLNQTNDSLNTLLNLSSTKDYGTIIADVSAFKEPIILELIQNGNTVQKAILSKPAKHVYSNLIPGEYQFRIISDSNENGIWDTGDFTLNRQPETVYLFSTPTKVRANWDIDVQLTPIK